MMNQRHAHQKAQSRQQGVTLVELMVTIAINLVLVLAATLLYLNTRTTQKEVMERSAVYETGQFAMGLLARDITTAGFYPASSNEPPPLSGVPTSNVRFTHDAVAKNMGMAEAFAHGVFGCNGQAFDVASRSCKNSSDIVSGSDALVLSYFTEDAFSVSAGQRADCTRTDVINDTTIAKNDVRATYLTGSGGGEGEEEVSADKVKPDVGPLPDSPLLVINAYALVPGTMTLDSGKQVNTGTLTCWGNGLGKREQLVQGVDQFVVTYGLMSDDSRRPVRYVTAENVATNSAEINGEMMSGWQLVTSVRVCMLVRSPQATTLRDSAAITDCRGNSVSREDGFQVRRFEQVFSIKNRQGNTVSLKLAQAAGSEK